MTTTPHPEEALVLRRIEAGVATLTLNRPKHYNACLLYTSRCV